MKRYKFWIYFIPTFIMGILATPKVLNNEILGWCSVVALVIALVIIREKYRLGWLDK